MNVTICITGGITPELAAQFQTVCGEIARAKVGRLSVLISSRGGDIISGLAMYNSLRLLKCPIRMVNMGQVGSIAATLFLAGDVRQAMPGANFFLHAAYFVEGAAKGTISPNTALILAPYSDRLGWAQDRLDLYFTKTEESYLTVEQAAMLGIVSDITPPEAWPPDELSVAMNPHGDEAPRLDAFISRLHKKART